MAIGKYLADNLGGARFSGLQLNDLATLLCGIKSVVFTSINSAEENRRVDSLCAELKLKKALLAHRRNVTNTRIIDILIGTNPKKIIDARRAYANVASPEWGLALGYPECCVRAYLDWRFNHNSGDLIGYIHQRTAGGKLLPFWMNNTVNYFSRLFTPEERKDNLAFLKLNPGQDRESIITWHPCSYLCAETMKKGKTLYEFMRKYMPDTISRRKAMLSKPVIFWDKFLFAVLNGNCRRKNRRFVVDYNGISRPKSLISAKTERALASFPRLSIGENGKITVPRSIPLPKGYIFLPFSAAF
ncbi:MAG: hypothetical protein KKH28_10565 [Elusimicrobia bacterium]|nr:hypothetical protein [Elusimicrobiota bacterium]